MKQPMIQADQLSKRFGVFTAVNKISLAIHQGEIFGFLGANGAGKSTAIKMLCGLLSPTSGKARVAGYDVYKQQNKIKQSIGYMSQRFSLYNDLTVFENMKFYGGIYGVKNVDLHKQIDHLLIYLGLKGEKDTLVKSLPLGWKQKLAFSTAMVHRPKIVFLDEPTGGVDPITRRQFWDMIYDAAESGVTVFVTTHYMDEAEYCDRISIMVDGKIEALGKPSDLKKQYDEESVDQIFKKLARSSAIQA